MIYSENIYHTRDDVKKAIFEYIGVCKIKCVPPSLVIKLIS